MPDVGLDTTQCVESVSKVPPGIRKEMFCSGRMARLEFTHSVKAVRDTAVSDYSTPSVNSQLRVVYPTPITVSPFLHVLSVSYLKQLLCRCGQQ